MKIVLAGFNGTWRREVAEILSKRLGRKLFDIEKMIEEKENDRVAHILQMKGVDYLRKLENSIIEEICNIENCIITVGPDLISSEKNRNLLKKNGIIIWFTAEPSIILLRINPGKESKSLLKKQNALFQIRQIIKEQDFSCFADRIVDTSVFNPEEAADKVQQLLSSF
ncbi:MAG: hypothetical protein NC913_09535 [Candidatus Omnitrophica bacterium]|nr:hypothetical protein [Candidatus Omnitrophota bacterium]